MGIRKVQSVGLQIDMTGYVRLHPSRSAPDFWYPSHQEVLRKLLAPFLPRMSYDASTNVVTASVIENGKELLSESKDSSTVPIPDKLLRELDALMQDLKCKVDTESMDPDTRSLLRAFKLPDQKKNPEMYRIYGDKRHPRLAILWGMEKYVGSSISVMDMNVSKNIHAPNRSGKGKWLAILLALAAGGIVWFCIDRANKQAEAERIRIEQEQAEAERIRLEQEEAERIRIEQEAEAERIRLEQKEAERIRIEQEAEAERIRLEQAEAERIRIEQEQAEAERIRLEQEEAERIRKEQEAEAERIRLEQEEAERIRKEQEAEAERIRLEQEEAERIRIAEEEARLKAEEEARLKAEEEARLKAEEEARLKAEEEARLKAEEEARLKAEEEARLKAEEEARLKAEEEARLKAEEEARLKAEEEARLKAEEEARLKAEEEARLKAERIRALEEEYRIKIKLLEEGGALPPPVSVSENLPFFVEKVKQEARKDGRINITLKLIPKDGTSFRSASINNIKVNPQTWQVMITITSKSQKVPVEVYVKGRKTPYSVDCTINISDDSLNSR